MILTIANLKGGVGRTTTAIYLACAYARAGHPVTVIDTDWRQGAADWAARADEHGSPLPFQVITHPVTETDGHAQHTRVAQIPDLIAPDTLAIIDTPSHDSGLIHALEEISEFVLVPAPPAEIDYQVTTTTLNQLTTPHAVLLTMVRANTRAEGEFRQRFAGQDVPVFSTAIPHRQPLAGSKVPTPGHDLFGYDVISRELNSLLKESNPSLG